jgi:hypothetical protein
MQKTEKRNPVTHREEEEEEKRSKLNSTHQCFI